MQSLKQFLAIAAAAIYGVVLATGALTIVLAITAAAHGYGLGDLHAEAFPRFRGGQPVTTISPIAYAMFFGYVIAAGQIAIVCRRRLAKRWSSR
jgi:hypothetical protein